MMRSLNFLIRKAEHSKFYLWLFNKLLGRLVPFNRPHRLKIVKISKDELRVSVENTRQNRNHIGSIHACLLATLCEYVSGLNLLLHFSPQAYRIILKNIHMTYHYQAKTRVYAAFKLSDEETRREILDPLQAQDAVFKELPVEVYDEQNNHICTGLINWQIKLWKNVKTKVA